MARDFAMPVPFRLAIILAAYFGLLSWTTDLNVRASLWDFLFAFLVPASQPDLIPSKFV